MNTICHCGDFGVTIRKRHSGHCPPCTWLPFINCSHTRMVLLLGLIGIASWHPGIAGRAIGATGWGIYGTSLANGFNVLIGQTFNHRILLSVAQDVRILLFCYLYDCSCWHRSNITWHLAVIAGQWNFRHQPIRRHLDCTCNTMVLHLLERYLHHIGNRNTRICIHNLCIQQSCLYSFFQGNYLVFFQSTR